MSNNTSNQFGIIFKFCILHRMFWEKTSYVNYNTLLEALSVIHNLNQDTHCNTPVTSIEFVDDLPADTGDATMHFATCALKNAKEVVVDVTPVSSSQSGSVEAPEEGEQSRGERYPLRSRSPSLCSYSGRLVSHS